MKQSADALTQKSFATHASSVVITLPPPLPTAGGCCRFLGTISENDLQRKAGLRLKVITRVIDML